MTSELLEKIQELIIFLDSYPDGQSILACTRLRKWEINSIKRYKFTLTKDDREAYENFLDELEE